ncbi:MAG TPA: hypothetical protein VMV46_05400 [Thermoanaerobaculia bacterium]|nr:hypothetical protein [Thermoanaerobaculia bacterium]
MTRRFVAPAVDPVTARRRLQPRRRLRDWLGGAVARPARGPLAGKLLPHLELIWLPFLLGSAPLAGGEPGRRLACLVCASTGLASRVELATQVFADPAEEVTLGAAAIGRERLEGIARDHLGRVARLAGARVSSDPGGLAVEEWALPFWVLCYERRPGRLDFATLDAVTGEKVGGAVRQALLRALVASPGRDGH